MNKILIILAVVLLLNITAAYSAVNQDPTEVGFSAKQLGLGRTSIGLADDINAINSNPAGLYDIRNWQGTSMYSKFIGDVSYMVLGGALPTKFGVLGIGFVSQGIDLGQETSISQGRVVPSGSNMNFYNNAYLLSYGRNLKNATRFQFLDKAAVGATFKLYSRGISGGSNARTASGYNLDAGLQYKLNHWLVGGFVAQNILPGSLGGKITTTQTNFSEGFAHNIKLGLGADIAGDNGLTDKKRFGRLAAGIDLNLTPLDKSKKSTLHIGMEWWPGESICLRAGFDQDQDSLTGNVVSNQAFGLGVKAAGVGFDYAYHKYGDLSDNATHFFSLSYVGAPEEKKDVVILKLTQPTPIEEGIDKYLTFTSIPKSKFVYVPVIKLAGQSKIGTVRFVEVNARSTEVVAGKFYIEVPLLYGKNPMNMAAIDEVGRRLGSARGNIVRLKSFKDVNPNYFARDSIEYLSTLGIVSGSPAGKFLPEKPITRAELCTMAVKLYDYKGTSLENLFKKFDITKISKGNIFKDVSNKYWAARAINICVEKKWISGYPDKTFKPNNPLTRSEAIAFISKFDDGKLPRLLAKQPFSDIPVKHWAAKYIAAAKDAGLLNYLEGRTFKPDYKFRRGEATLVLSKTKIGIQRIKSMVE